MRLIFLVLALFAVACGQSSSATTPSPSETMVATPTGTPRYVPFSPTPAAPPTLSPSPVPILHPPPYLIAIEAGHGGLEYWGGTGRDSHGRLWIEKDVTLAVAERVQELLAEAGYNSLLLRTSDTTLTDWSSANYRGSMIAETQARVDRANAVGADVYLSIHFNGWNDGSQHGTEVYCNPDRSFGNESCNLAWFVQQGLVQSVRGADYDVFDRGTKNDAQVNGDPQNPHSFVLGTNANFSPSLMPGIIAEVLFLSNPDDLAFLQREDAIDVIAAGFVDGLNAYFAWLTGWVAG